MKAYSANSMLLLLAAIIVAFTVVGVYAEFNQSTVQTSTSVPTPNFVSTSKFEPQLYETDNITKMKTLAGDLNPDDFHRMNIDVEAEVKRLSAFPEKYERGSHSRYAYVLIHYEGTPNDALYVLGTRVVIRSIKETGTKQDVIVLCANNVAKSSIEQFTRDGARIKMVPNIPNPYKAEQQLTRTYKARFEFTFNKLYIWNLLEYERIMYMDADTLITRNIDELFLCGHYCVTFFNPLLFHTGLMIVKPDVSMWTKLLKGLLSLEVFSYDGADQGFLTAAFPGIEEAPLFNPARTLAENNGRPSEAPLMRYPLEYNFNAVFGDGAMSFDHFRLANLPFSFLHHFQQTVTRGSVPESTLLSPYTATYPPFQLDAKNPGGNSTLSKALMATPQSPMDFELPVASLDYPLPVAFKPWNYIPYIFLHTCRYWSPVRNRIEAFDLSKGFLPNSHSFFLRGLNLAVLPLILMPFFMNFASRMIPGMDNVRKGARKVVRVTGTTVPAVILVLISLLLARSIVADAVPLETRPELAFICVFLCFVLAQFNVAHLTAILLAPPCPDMFKGGNNSINGASNRSGNLGSVPQSLQVQMDGFSQLEEIGIHRTPIYGITWSQLTQFFSSFGTIDYVKTRTGKSMGASAPSGMWRARSTQSKISSSMLRSDDNFDSLDLEPNSPPETPNRDNNAINNIDPSAPQRRHSRSFSNVSDGLTGYDDVSEDDIDFDEEEPVLDIDFVYQECDFQQNLTISTLSFKQKTSSFLVDIAQNLSTGSKKSQKNATFPNSKTQSSYQLLNKGAQDARNQHQLASDDVDLDIDMMDHELDPVQDRTQLAGLGPEQLDSLSASTSFSNPKPRTGFISPTQQDQMVQNALRKTAPSLLSSALSLRGGIYPSLMIIHIIILSIMALNLAKYGTYTDFINKIVYVVIFLCTFVAYSIAFLKKIMQIALGEPTSLAKIYL